MGSNESPFHYCLTGQSYWGRKHGLVEPLLTQIDPLRAIRMEIGRYKLGILSLVWGDNRCRYTAS